jgi:3-phosphoshikimate 1-carboxyvinyltransferase
MSKLISSKSELHGRVRIPGSKSHTIRAVAFASLAEGESVIHCPLVSLDTKSAVECYRALGAKITTEAGKKNHPIWLIKGFSGKPVIPENVIDVGNSGTSLRIALGTASLIEKGMIVLTGDEQIRKRPAAPLMKSLNELGASVTSARENGLAPFVVKGTLIGGKTEMEAVSSQFLTSLLMNCPMAKNDTQIVLTKLNEKPYVEMTLNWLDRLGIRYENFDFKEFTVFGGQNYKSFEYDVAADFSSATFFLCAAVLAGKDVEILGLDMSDTQGDKEVINYLKRMGASIEVGNRSIIVNRSELKGIDIDMNATPDALPAMAVIACFAKGKTRLLNVHQARIKETDRIAVMREELSRLGARITELPDGLEIEGENLKGGEVQGHGDHRVVMAMSLAGLKTEEPIIVNGAEAAAVTFPEYVELMYKLGAMMKLSKS